MSVKGMLFVAMTAMTLVTVIVGVIALEGLQTENAHLKEIVLDARKAEIIGDIKQKATQNSLRNARMIISNDPAAIARIEQEKNEAVAQITDEIGTLDGMLTTPRGRELLANIKAARKPYVEAFTESMKSVKAGNKADAYIQFDKQVMPAWLPFSDALDQLAVREATREKDAADHAEATARTLTYLTASALVLAIVVALGVSVWIMKSILGTLGGEPKAVAESAALMAGGDLRHTISATRIACADDLMICASSFAR